MCKNSVVSGVVTVVVAVAISCGLCCMSCCKKNNIAVVDVQKVVESSKAVEEFRVAQQNAEKALQEWIEKSNAEVEKVKGEKEKTALINKYREEFEQKRANLQESNIQSLHKLDADMTAVIEKVAKAAGFNKAFPKNTVIFGGTDITEDVINAMK